MEVLEAIKKRRSIRVYKPKPIDDVLLNQIIEAGRLAPSWANTQTARFIVVKDNETKTKLADESVRSGNMGINAVKTAPIVIAACAELNKAGFRKGQPATDKDGFWYMFDTALALENMVLAAESLGLGTLFVGGIDAKKAADILGVPEGFAFVILMVLGYPDEQPKAQLRKEPAEIVFREKFGEH